MTEVDQSAPEPTTEPAAKPRHRTLRATLFAVGIVAIAILVPTLGTHGNAATSAQLRTAIVDYYRLLPGDTAQAWDDLTPAYQNYVGGRAGFESFWSQYDHITLSDLSASAPGSVTVTVAYHYRTGGLEVEKTDFTLVDQSGQWRIDRSSVVSHHTEAG